MIADDLPRPEDENEAESSPSSHEEEETVDASVPESKDEEVADESVVEEDQAAGEETVTEALEDSVAEPEEEAVAELPEESEEETVAEEEPAEEEEPVAEEEPAEEPEESPEPIAEEEEQDEDQAEEETVTAEDSEEEGEEQEGDENESRQNLQWYVVKVQSGREETIKDAIERRVKIDGLEQYFGQVYIPYEEIVEMRRGKRVTRRGKKLPGYIMAQVEFNDEILYLFRETSGVGDFVGGGPNHDPTPMSPAEIKQWMGTDKKAGEDAEEGKKPVEETIPYSIGDRVKVKTGMFNGMEGEIKTLDHEKGTIHVEVTIFGRGVDAELEHWNVEPAS